MDQKFGFSRVLAILLLCLSIHSTNGEIQPIQGCSLQGVELQDCLAESANSGASESCCRAINLAAQAGAYCLCMMLRSSTPLLGLALSFQLSDCAISIPLTQCQNELPVFHAPDPSSFSKPPFEHSTSDDFTIPSPEEKDEIPQNSAISSNESSLDNTHMHSDQFGNMKSHGGEKFQSVLNAGLLVFVAWAIMQ